jgi:hypothetical protein
MNPDIDSASVFHTEADNLNTASQLESIATSF